jgi:hypothetical protein
MLQWHSGLTSGYLPYDRGFQETVMFTLYDYIGAYQTRLSTVHCVFALAALEDHTQPLNDD